MSVLTRQAWVTLTFKHQREDFICNAKHEMLSRFCTELSGVGMGAGGQSWFLPLREAGL